MTGLMRHDIVDYTAPVVSAETIAADTKDRDLRLPQTPTTYWLRRAVSGDGPHAYDWQDKPHRVVYDACSHADRLSAEIARLRAHLAVAKAALVASDHTRAFAEVDAALNL